MARGRARSDLDEDRQLELSIVRLLEIIGEAASRVPDEERERLPQIAWREIVDFRNRVIHGYDTVDLNIVWQIVQVDLPRLVAALEATVDAES